MPLSGLTEKLKNIRFEPSGLTKNPAVPHATSLVDYIFRYLEQRFVTGQQATLPLIPVPFPTRRAQGPSSRMFAAERERQHQQGDDVNGYHREAPLDSLGAGLPGMRLRAQLCRKAA